MLVINRDRYPESTFLDDSEFRQIGTGKDGLSLILVGYEDGDNNSPLIAKTLTPDDLSAQELKATPLYELLKFSQPGDYTIF